jgi:hypothetical protein
MIRCVRLWSGEDGQSQVQVGALRLDRPGESGPSKLSEFIPAQGISFEETPLTSWLTWHVAPHRQLVITVSGTLNFVTCGG